MGFVLDASISAVWALADEASPIAETAQDRLASEIALVPSLWWYEVRNVLIVNERRKRLTIDDSAIYLKLLSSYPIQTDPIEDENDTLQLARQYRLSYYDASYLSVAHRNRLPLATVDEALQDAARGAGIQLLS